VSEWTDVTTTVGAWLRDRGYAVDLDGGRALSFEAAKGECLVEVDPAGRVLCQFGIDLDELRDLIAGASTEDLGDDELQRAARYHLQTLCQPYQNKLKAAGFEEEYDVTDEHAVISFTHPVDATRPDGVLPVLQRCVDLLR
jgi:hypothetical protein